jgi:hypothetical protein
LILILFPVFSHVANAQKSAFLGDWEVTVVKVKTKSYPPLLPANSRHAISECRGIPGFGIKYPIRMSFHENSDRLVGSYTDQCDFSENFSIVAVERNEILLVVGGAGKKSDGALMPVHRAILQGGMLHGYVITDRTMFEWFARRKQNQSQ